MKSRGKLSVMLITPLTDNHCQIFVTCIRSTCPLSMHGGLTLWNTVELAHLIPFGIHDSGSVRLLKLQIGTNEADDVTGNSSYVYMTEFKEIMFYKFKSHYSFSVIKSSQLWAMTVAFSDRGWTFSYLTATVTTNTWEKQNRSVCFSTSQWATM